MRRIAAGVLLFLLLGDLTLHVAESFLEEPSAVFNDPALFTRSSDIHADESNCPIPGHSSGRFHHHHFPGIIASDSFTAPSTLRQFRATSLVELRGSAISIAHPGRAPPLV